MANILLIEDDRLLGASIRSLLLSKKHPLIIRTDGRRGLAEARLRNYSLIILDLVLPGLDGISICRTLRSEGVESPVMMLTSRDAIDDIVQGLEVGADAYLAKPFSGREFLARVQSLVKRPPSTLTPTFSQGKLTIDKLKRVVIIDDQVLDLRRKEFDILLLLAEHPGRALTRSQINARTADGPVIAEDAAVDVHISNIRKKVGHVSKDEVIETVYGFGYRLVCD